MFPTYGIRLDKHANMIDPHRLHTDNSVYDMVNGRNPASGMVKYKPPVDSRESNMPADYSKSSQFCVAREPKKSREGPAHCTPGTEPDIS